MITIKNSQRKTKLDTKKVKALVEGMLEKTGYKNFDIGIWFTTNKTIRAYNKRFRKTDRPTDILSFPYHPNLKPGGKIKISNVEDENLGDIIISLELVKKDAEGEGRSLIEHIKILLAHGIAHLLGYDHKTEKDFAAMQRFTSHLQR